jgi:SAM-dependent methyltransferase
MGHGEAPGAPIKDERVFRYFGHEREILRGLPAGARVLDLGCSDGAHVERLSMGGRVFGVDVAQHRLARAKRVAPVAAALGEHLPFRDEAFDFVYVSHVLHHAAEHVAVLRQIHRVLKPGGVLFLIETVDDNPVMRLARTLRPEWDSDPVTTRFRFGPLISDIRGAGFEVEAASQFNVLWWMWAFVQRTVRPLGRFPEQAARAEMAAVRRLRRFGAWGYVVGRRTTSG